MYWLWTFFFTCLKDKQYVTDVEVEQFVFGGKVKLEFFKDW